MLERITDKNIIVMDLEWNQGNYYVNHKIPHEIIEIGACKIDNEGNIVSKFSYVIKPKIYRKIDKHIYNVTGITQDELDNGIDFITALDLFEDWSAGYEIVTWGRDDYPVLKRNAEYYKRKLNISVPIDIQMIYGFIYHNNENRQINLHAALEEMNIKKEIIAHRAVYDAEATICIFPDINEKLNLLDKKEIDRIFEIIDKEKKIALSSVVSTVTNYEYISDVIKNKNLLSVKCPICRTNSDFEIPWFDVGREKYETLCYCKSHGDIIGIMNFKRGSKKNLIVCQRYFIGTMEYRNNIEKKYEAFKRIPEKKRHHRMEMKF